MLYYKNAHLQTFWLYYVEKVIAEGCEEYVFKKNGDRPYLKFVEKEECYFLKIEEDKNIYDILISQDGKTMIDRFNVELNWSVYLFKDNLVAMSPKIPLEKISY